MALQIIFSTGAFLTVMLLVATVYRQFFLPRQIVRDRLADYTGQNSGPQPSGTSEVTVKDETYRLLGRIGKGISGHATLEKVQIKLTKARIPMKAEELIGLSFVIASAALLIFWLLAGSILFGIICAVIGFYLPLHIVERRKRKRMEMLNRQLPDALDIISNGLRAGFSFTQALGVVARETEPPIADEFARVLRKNQLGKPMADVLRELSEHTDSDDFDMVVTALLIQRQVGGNLAEILDNVAHTVRERIRIKGEIRTLTAQGRITAVIVSLLPAGVAVMLFMMNPGYIMVLFTELPGMIMFGTAVILQILGIIVLRKIINIEV